MSDFPIIEKLGGLLVERGFLKGKRIAWHCHLTTITAQAAQAVSRAGAELVFSECNVDTTQKEALAELATCGKVFLGPDSRLSALKSNPHIIADTGFALSETYLEERQKLFAHQEANLLGISEITTSGIARLRKRLKEKSDFHLPVLNINDGKLKTEIENFHGVGDGVVEILKDRLPDLMVVIVGYGAVGAGCARHLKDAGARVQVVELSAVRALMAHYDGFELTDLRKALGNSDVIVTATGRRQLLGEREWRQARHGLTVLNVGHDANEVSTDILRKMADKISQAEGGLSLYRLSQSPLHEVALYTQGSPANVALLTGSEEPTLIHLTTEILGWDYLIEEQGRLPEGEIIIAPEVEERAASLALQALGQFQP